MEEHHLVGGDGTARARLDGGVGGIFEVDQLFWKVGIEGFIHNEAEGTARGVFADEDDTAEIETIIDIGVGYRSQKGGGHFQNRFIQQGPVTAKKHEKGYGTEVVYSSCILCSTLVVVRPIFINPGMHSFVKM